MKKFQQQLKTLEFVIKQQITTMKYAKEIIIGFILFYFTILIAIEISSLKEEIKKNEIEIIELKNTKPNELYIKELQILKKELKE
jgi:hypothetical protein